MIDEVEVGYEGGYAVVKVNQTGITDTYCSCHDGASAVMDSITVAMGRSVACPNCILGSTGDVLQSYESGYADVIHAAVNAFRSEVTLGQARMSAWFPWLPTLWQVQSTGTVIRGLANIWGPTGLG